MSKFALKFSILSLIAASCFATVQAQSRAGLYRLNSDDDESGCLCGLNGAILDKLESIVQTSISSSCLVPATSTGSDDLHDAHSETGAGGGSNVDENFYGTTHQANTNQQQEHHQNHKVDQPGSGNQIFVPGHELTGVGSDPVSQVVVIPDSQGASSSIVSESTRPSFGIFSGSNPSSETSWQTGSNSNLGSSSPNSGSNSNSGVSSSSGVNGDLASQLAAEIAKLQASLQQALSANQNSQQVGPTTETHTIHHETHLTTHHNRPGTESTSTQPSSSSSSGLSGIFSNGLLGGIPSSIPVASNNEALAKLNQSQKVDVEDMESALQSTIPSVVSNIFSNIQNLTIATEQEEVPNRNPGLLTSIDGSSIALASNSSISEITADGEQLFSRWIEHQIEMLHLTASMANYIRKSSMNLFRRIMRQYVERIEKLGGNIQDNVRLATQASLYITQRLTSHLMRNYINFAGGLMQIIGEQVSRVGKQIDTTGAAISKVSLNPFDIVSNVIDSLPNPSDYSKYFREFGKQIMGGAGSAQTTPAPQSGSTQIDSPTGQQQDPNVDQKQNNNPSTRPYNQGLISKTMGALSKTFGHWIG